MEGGKRKVDSKKKQNLYTYLFISTGNLKKVALTSIQFNILKLISQRTSNYFISQYLHCSTANIRYHLKKLSIYNLVQRKSENCVWEITNEGLQVIRGGKERRLTPLEKVDRKGLLLQNRAQGHDTLTKQEEKIYDLIANQRLKPSQVILKLKCTKQNVYKILKKLRKKGYLGGGNKKVDFLDVGSQPLSPLLFPPLFRLHNMRWSIRFSQKIPNFKGIETIVLDQNKIKIWEKTIEIYSTKDFWGETPQESFDKSFDYWYQEFVKLENKLKIKFIKNNKCSIELTKCEFANSHNEIAHNCLKEGKKLKVYNKSGELWALVDNSHNLFEFETVRSRSAKQDMERICQVLNDYREDSNVMSPKQMQKKIEMILEIMHNNSIMQNNIYKSLEVITSEMKRSKWLTDTIN